MVFINAMKTVLLKTHKQHRSIFGANSKEEFQRRRARLKNNSDERKESLENAESHKKRENRQVCAGTSRIRVCRVLIFSAIIVFALALFKHLTQSVHAFITITRRHVFIPIIPWLVKQYRAPVDLHCRIEKSPCLKHLYKNVEDFIKNSNFFREKVERIFFK